MQQARLDLRICEVQVDNLVLLTLKVKASGDVLLASKLTRLKQSLACVAKTLRRF